MKELALPVGLIGVIACMLLPLPPFAVDCLLVVNLIFAILLVVSALYLTNPLKLSSLPTILLLATLYRLALNISTTRRILGTGDAGDMIEMFGDLLMQGDIFVGVVVFLVLTLVQFIVIAKGSERVAEVSARFTLDALPGKQMSIDADVRSGLIDMQTARNKRESLQVESRFYGALDGAMKFIKGDAIAGLVITAVNIIGGLLVGIAVQGLPVELAFKKYTLLTLGDGLLSQIPALLNSLAAGLIVTRVAREDGDSLANEVLTQLGSARAPLFLSGVVAFFLAFVGVATLSFLMLGAALCALGAYASRSSRSLQNHSVELFEPRLPPMIQLQISDRSPFVTNLSPELIRIEMMRLLQRVYDEKGLLLTPPDITVVSDIESSAQISFRGLVEKQTLIIEDELDETKNNASLLMEFTYQHILRRKIDCIDDIFTRRLLDHTESIAPELVTATVPGVISVTTLTSLLRSLLDDEISIRNIDLILQAVVEHSEHAGNERAMLEEVRIFLKRHISEQHAKDGALSIIRLDPVIDLAFVRSERDGIAIDPEMILLIERYLGTIPEDQEMSYLIASKGARRLIQDCLNARGHKMTVLAEEEIAPHIHLEEGGVILMDENHVEEYFEKLVA